jgi:polyisoprenyl-phosphate glycosyltransferase
MTELSVVIPVYGCKACLRSLHERLTTSLQSVTDSYEIVLVDDASPDDAWSELRELAAGDSHVRSFRLSRNFGQHAAITAGLERSQGRWVVIMDCDLQDPPELIPRLHAKATEGFDIVFAERKRTGGTHPLRRLASRLYSMAMNRLAGADIDFRHGSFSIISRQVVDAFLSVNDRDRHYLLILYWLGFDVGAVDYEQLERPHGSSSYTPKRLLRHAVDAIFFQTTVLLRWIVYLGFVLATTGASFAVYLIISKLTGAASPGWTSLAVFTLLLSGFIIISTGITGLYVGKVFEQVKGRPLYVVAESTEHQLEPERARGLAEGV